MLFDYPFVHFQPIYRGISIYHWRAASMIHVLSGSE